MAECLGGQNATVHAISNCITGVIRLTPPYSCLSASSPELQDVAYVSKSGSM